MTVLKTIANPLLKSAMYLFDSFGKIEARTMFGGFGIFSNGVMFSMVIDDCLYIRTTKETVDKMEAKGYSAFKYKKKGFLSQTKYYLISIGDISDNEQVVVYGKEALKYAIRDKVESNKSTNKRLRDLPNITLNMEKKLIKHGINTVEELHSMGAVAAFKQIESEYQDVESKSQIILSLEGAVMGLHKAVIPESSRTNLLSVVN